MAEITLTATPRTPKGTRTARRLRGEGKVPGVLYGMGADAVPLTVEWRELRAALVTEQGLNAVIHIEVDGEKTPTLVKDMQRHPVRRNVLHIDFIRVDLDKPVDVEVSISLEGEAEAVSREGGVVDQVLLALHITAKPSDIPSGLSVDISGLEIGEALRVGDIVLPAGVTTSVDAEEPEFLLVMEKRGHEEDGWYWAAWKGDGDEVVYAAEDVGHCVQCHESGEDLVRGFDLPPN